ncbi:egg protein C122-like [Schistosoma mansoni]|uniref:egg protein C122-like n=1 Tax=Schistosoma mansoni TaxID=6183 RepID=UPI0001A635FE|nr:egg protein C122-like [Schistosoma mansoni]|eukprot:XP_018649582.1 egg protein C122-like [Schistosoma mansoni]
MMMKNSWLLSAIIAVSAVFVQSDDLSYTVPKDLAEYVYFDKCYKIAEQTAVVKNDNQPIKNEPIVEPTVAVNTGSEVISDTQSKSEQLKVTESNPIITNQERIITGNTNTAQQNTGEKTGKKNNKRKNRKNTGKKTGKKTNKVKAVDAVGMHDRL